MESNRKTDREFKNILNELKESNQIVAENTEHTNEKLDDIKNVINELKESNQIVAENTGHANKKLDDINQKIKKIIESKESRILGIITIIISIIGIIISCVSKTESNVATDESQNVEQVENSSVETNTDELPNSEWVEEDNKENDDPSKTDQVEEDVIEFSAYEKVIDFEKNKFWDSKKIAGIPYDPDLEVLKCITDAVDYTCDWDAYEPLLLYWPEDTEGEKIALVGKTENFLIYDISKNHGSMLIKTSEDSFVLAEGIPSTTTNGAKNQPSFIEADFDNDGENELAIQILLRTGTGYSADSLYMLDKTSNGQWYMFQFPLDDFIYIIEKNISGKVIEGNLYFVWDEEVVFIPERFVDETYYQQFCIGDIVFIEISSEEIRIKFDVGHGSDYLIDYSSGHGISAKVLYVSEGIWGIGDANYYNDSLERYITKIMGFYLTGDVEALSQECNFTFPISTQDTTEYDIVEFIYDSKNFGKDTFDVIIKYVVDHSDITHHATFTIKQMYSDDLSDDLWKICDFHIIK